MIKQRVGPIAVAALVLAAVQVTAAGAATSASEEPRACMEELQRFCPDVPPGAGRLLLCLQQHDPELSGPCRGKLQRVLKRIAETQQACAGDVTRFCADIAPGENRLIKCLSPHLEELAPACRQKGAWIGKTAEQAASGRER